MKIELSGFVGDVKVLPNGDTVFVVNTGNGKNRETGKYNNFYVDCRVRAGDAHPIPTKDSRVTVTGGFLVRSYLSKDGAPKVGGNVFVDSIETISAGRSSTGAAPASFAKSAPSASFDIPESW